MLYTSSWLTIGEHVWSERDCGIVERHYKGRMISVFGEEFDSDLDIDIAFPIIYLPKLPHLASVGKP